MHGPDTSILLADSDEHRRRELAAQLHADEYEVVCASAGEEARVKMRNHGPHVLLLGALDTPTAALALTAAVREGHVQATGVDPDRPVIVMADPSPLTVLRAFDRGADDVVATDVSYLELRARIQALVRRASGELRGTQMTAGGLCVDRRLRSVSYQGRDVALSALEFALLARLMAEPERVLDKRTLLADVWGMPEGVRTRTVDAHACRVRAKLAAAGAGHLIVNRRGVGYALTEGRRSDGEVEVIGHAA
jgi:DNA-binding response OmpR family regulator